ncbi:MAG: hypothetical protein WAO58_13405 [Fimbriimonadaceae bacterium]
MRRAVIDVGSNSVLLVVAELREGVWIPVMEASSVTGLGEGTKKTGVLSEAGLAKTLKAVRKFYDRAIEAGADRLVAAATMAARIASNTDEFLARAQSQNTPVTVLSGDDEADLGFKSVAEDPTFAHRTPLSIVDVGGQSTEIVFSRLAGKKREIRFSHSFPIGTLALRSGVLHEESPSVASRMFAVQEIDDAIALNCQPGEAGRVVALGATATNLVTIREAMAAWEPRRVHGAFLDYEEIGRSVGWLCSMTDSERAGLAGIEKGREGTIHIGALILERCLFALSVEGCLVSVRGWRHALLGDGRWFGDEKVRD